MADTNNTTTSFSFSFLGLSVEATMSSRMATVSHSVSDRFPPPSATLDADTDGDLAQVGTGLLVSIGDDEPTKSAPHRDWEGTLTPPELPASEIDQVACWICYGEHLESPGQAWVRPCRCKGTLKYVHESCLLHYIAARAGTATRVCPHCAIEYKLVTPPVTSPVVRMVDHVQKTVHEHRPFVLYTCALLLMLGPAAPALGMADPRWHMRAWAGVRSASKAMLLGTCFGYGRILPLLPAWFAHVAAPLMQEVPGSDWQPPSLATMALALPWISLAWSTAAAYAAGVLLLPRLMRQTPVRDPETESMEWHVEQARSELEIPEFHSLSRAIQKLVLGSVLALVAQAGPRMTSRMAGFNDPMSPRMFHAIGYGYMLFALKDSLQVWYRWHTWAHGHRSRVLNFRE